MIGNSVDSSQINQQVYTDLSGLRSISRLGRENTAEGMRKVAEQFEAVFINMMLKEMRQSHASLFEDNYLSSNEMDIHQQNYDNQISMHLAGAGGIGLADTIHRQMMQRYDISDPGETQPRRPSRLVPAVPRPSISEQVSERVSGQAQGRSLEQTLGDAPSQTPAFGSPHDFVNRLLPLARPAADRLGVDPEALIAQSALETGWGEKVIRHRDGSSSHNLFGIKADSSWSGDRVAVSTLEYREGVARQERASFRAYASFEESFNDYVQFLHDNPRYAEALDASHDNEAFMQQLQQAGYATDPLYAEKVGRVLNSPIMQSALLQSAGAGNTQ